MITTDTNPNRTDYGLKITVRGTGKSHRAWLRTDKRDGSEYISIACSCPGSSNGRLRNRTRFLCEGWDRATCETR